MVFHLAAGVAEPCGLDWIRRFVAVVAEVWFSVKIKARYQVESHTYLFHFTNSTFQDVLINQ